MDEIELRIPDDYCQGESTEYTFQAPPEELKLRKPKSKLKSVKVTREDQ